MGQDATLFYPRFLSQFSLDKRVIGTCRSYEYLLHMSDVCTFVVIAPCVYIVPTEYSMAPVETQTC